MQTCHLSNRMYGVALSFILYETLLGTWRWRLSEHSMADLAARYSNASKRQGKLAIGFATLKG